MLRAQRPRIRLLSYSGALTNLSEDLRGIVEERTGLDAVTRVSTVGSDFILAFEMEVLLRRLQQRQIESTVDGLLNSQHDVENHVEVLMCRVDCAHAAGDFLSGFFSTSLRLNILLSNTAHSRIEEGRHPTGLLLLEQSLFKVPHVRHVLAYLGVCSFGFLTHTKTVVIRLLIITSLNNLFDFMTDLLLEVAHGFNEVSNVHFSKAHSHFHLLHFPLHLLVVTDEVQALHAFFFEDGLQLVCCFLESSRGLNINHTLLLCHPLICLDSRISETFLDLMDSHFPSVQSTARPHLKVSHQSRRTRTILGYAKYVVLLLNLSNSCTFAQVVKECILIILSIRNPEPDVTLLP
mmetsp:Transcript_21874/g.33912  ORF Transcript_21874/g.33912 Transcript_21874/m.33912 type:complete len:349 (-) Transcript_21874:2438-3484(-)